MQQRTDEWFNARIGKITASRIKDIDAKPKSGKALNSVLLTVLAERLTGVQLQNFVNAAMQWGIDNEPNAIKAYEWQYFTEVEPCGLIDHPTIPMSGASPDGLVGDDGQIEIKCPNTETHLNTIITGKIPSEYLPQITWQLACTGRDWCDFVSYDPRLEPKLQIHIIRVYRGDLDIAGLEQKVIQANEIINEHLEKIKGKL
ncbi:lambda exonuclease family protein [Moraxella catarrhalis]|uniref:lambda exonuclease family protein n=1 Tax=Moraxella catarrhalis TaxID=480 RepID=UPI000EA9438B|nr:lambda exonuclease family protein [Moraxella catarrhalis]MPX79047.1 exonuclease [Moraxella catarrhalis]RKL82629.1 exonuclease [Moraxella catarrhalis]RKM00287.1 exonuclease [Moraxella catarrhalis]RKM34934.1 exonuclease [Moraxella catarrhalis]RKM37859.1 exonuclease [Moraxella catarrhalis]